MRFGERERIEGEERGVEREREGERESRKRRRAGWHTHRGKALLGKQQSDSF